MLIMHDNEAAELWLEWLNLYEKQMIYFLSPCM